MAEQAPPEDVNNANTGSAAGGEDASAVATPTFPDRLRVHALAKIIGVTSKQVLAKLGELGIEARSAQSSLGRDAAETVYSSFNPPAGTPASQAPVSAPVVEASPVVEATPVEPERPESNLSVKDAEPAPARAARPTFSTPLFLQPEAPAEAPPKRRRSRKAAGPAADTDTATADTGTTDATAETTIETSTETDGRRDDRSDSVVTTGTAAAESAQHTKSSGPEDTSAQNTSAQNSIAQDTTAEDATSDRETSDDSDDNSDGDDDQGQPRRRRRGRRGRGRGRGDQSNDSGSDDSGPDDSISDYTGNENTDSENADDESLNSESSGDAAETSDSDGDETSARRPRRRGRSWSNANANANANADTNSDTDSGTNTPDSDDEQDSTDDSETDVVDEAAGEDSDDDQDGGDGSSRRRRRRRRRRTTGDASPDSGSSDEASSGDDPPNTVVHEREPRNKSRNKDEVQGITGSTRLEAKRQRRRDGRDAGRRRPPILTESEFLARRESVDRVMVVREKSFDDGRETTQVAVLEDGVLVEHFVTSSESASMVGNVYLGRVQNVLPSMEAAFIDIGRGRNGVLYAGEVNWDAAGLGGNSRKIEQALKPGDQVLVQVSKDPVGHKGARLTTQLSLAGRFLVYVPGGSSTGISRKLPDTERKRLKEILRGIVPSEAGVIIRTAAEGVSEEELARDVLRLQAQWATIEEASAKAESGKGSQPQTLYEEPDLLVKVIRDLFNEDFVKLVIEGERAWATTSSYIETVAAEMLPKLERHTSEPGRPDVFEAHRIDEQLSKALDRKVWLPSGGTLVIDRTEAMTVVDVNTGKFTGAGGNLEETVTRNNLEAAEEVVRQMRLRDIGGMIVVDFIDMVLESNRDLVLRRLTEALGRDRTRHQVSEVTSLGLVQMTRKKLGTGLIEAFSTNCEHCQGRGITVHPFPVESKQDDGSRSNASRGDSGSQRKRRGREKSDTSAPSAPQIEDQDTGDSSVKRAHPAALAMAAHHDDVVADVTPAEVSDGRGDWSREATAVDAADVAAVQVKTASSETSATEVSPSTDASAPVGAATEVSAVDSGASSSGAPRARGRRKASRPAASSTGASSTGASSSVGSSSAGTSSADPAQASVESPAPATEVAATGAPSSDVTAPEQPQSDAPAPEASTGEPVVKARRGRRVARKAAAPSSEAPDAGATIVIATDHDAPSAAAEPDQTAITSPAAASAGAADSPDLPASKPRRRRASVRPAGPPADA